MVEDELNLPGNQDNEILQAIASEYETAEDFAADLFESLSASQSTMDTVCIISCMENGLDIMDRMAEVSLPCI